MDEKLQLSLTRLRAVLDSIPASKTNGEVPEDVGLAVDDLRSSLWGALTTSFAADAEDYLVTMRIRRANEMLKEVLADLYTGGMSMRGPGADELRRATSDLRTALEEAA